MKKKGLGIWKTLRLQSNGTRAEVQVWSEGSFLRWAVYLE